MEITPDQIILLELGPLRLNATLVFTWLVMGLLTGVSWGVTRNLRTHPPIPRWQHVLEVVVGGLREQLSFVCHGQADRYLPFIGTLFLFIALSNVLAFIPGYHPPTGSLNTTAALALCVLIAVPVFGISQLGVREYLKHYIRPTAFVLPFNIIGEISKTISLAVRLYGNMMAGTIIMAILLLIVPFFVPVLMQAFELLIGLIQAFIFSVLATVYIASAAQAHQETEKDLSPSAKDLQ